MGNVDNNLIDRIERTVEHLISKMEPNCPHCGSTDIIDLSVQTDGGEFCKCNGCQGQFKKDLNEKKGVVGRLNRLAKDIEGGMIPGVSDFELIDFYEPRSILPNCEHISPLGKCKAGFMEYCKHRAEWKCGENTCKKYVERFE